MAAILLLLPRMALATDPNKVGAKDKDKERENMEPIPKNLAPEVSAKIMLVKTLVKDRAKAKAKDKAKVKDKVKVKVRGDKDKDSDRTKANNKDKIKVQDKAKMHLLDLWQTGSILPIRLKVNSRTVKR
jgi:hypothetical protein